MNGVEDGQFEPIARFDELRAILGDEKFRSLARRFAADLSFRLAEIKSLGASRELLAVAAHKLVGVAGALGLKELAVSGANLSRCARDADDDALTVVVSKTAVLGEIALGDLHRVISSD